MDNMDKKWTKNGQGWTESLALSILVHYCPYLSIFVHSELPLCSNYLVVTNPKINYCYVF